MSVSRKNIRVDDSLLEDIKIIAKENNQSENQVIESALKLYRDFHYMGNKACIINEQILSVFQGCCRMLENTINQKTNKVLSELAIQAHMQNLILAQNLEVSLKDLTAYRLRAIDFLRENNRVLRLDEVVQDE